ncbi:hypothetical protein GCM10007901_37610 [Dyella acidisoli]|uniref:Uncharacterized protein n=1 Tax=Dyella acidisoli TaxID=1867834 RepID=A0ABQ5XUQ7_9GAMM|nr:hypothetical protein GCM10007901_37610 [Dyella acidisoli]
MAGAGGGVDDAGMRNVMAFFDTGSRARGGGGSANGGGAFDGAELRVIKRTWIP